MANTPDPTYPRPTVLQWLRFSWRFVAFFVGSVLIITAYMVLYALEKILPFRQSNRMPQLWGQMGVFLLGVKVDLHGKPMKHGGALVANHVSWIDIFVLHSLTRVTFVAKSEVQKWPFVGFLAAVVGTVFIERRTSQAGKHQAALKKRLDRGDPLCFFPEGTSTDGRRVFDFKSTLFAVFHAPEIVDTAWIQPATLTYFAPKGQEDTFYGWGGDMPFFTSLMHILALSVGGRVRVTLHDAVRAADYNTRKDLAKYCGDMVREQLAADLNIPLSEAGQIAAPSP